jgi:MoaA/NifB/PqqE/SkfB family radical SAM enzyme
MRAGWAIRTGWGIVGPPRPLILYHLPTLRCECRCRFCDSWQDQPGEDDCLPAAPILSLLERSRAAGMTIYAVWGGEPLLAEPLPEWLRRARALGMMTTICTSGSHLEERAQEIAPHIDKLLLSLEAVGERHDRVRGNPGLFARVVTGLREYRRQGGGKVVLWSNISRETMDQVEDIARLAREEKIGVEFFPLSAFPGYNERMVLARDERERVFAEVEDLKRRGYPVFNHFHALEIMRTGRPFQCNLARMAVQVFPDGRVFACYLRLNPDLKPYGNMAELDLAGLRKSAAYQEARESLARCNACLLPCVANMADSLTSQALRRFFNLLYYR